MKWLSHAQFHHQRTDVHLARPLESIYAATARVASSRFIIVVSFRPVPSRFHTHSTQYRMSLTATTELGPASGPDATLKPEETPTHKAPRQHPSHEEYQYLDLIRDILESGEHRPDR